MDALAQAAPASQSTIRGILKGNRAYMQTFARIAKPLGVSANALLAEPESTVSNQTEVLVKPKPGITADIRINIPYELFDETTQLERLINALNGAITAIGAISINLVKPGSVIVQLHFSEERDVRELIKAFCSMRFMQFGVQLLSVAEEIDATSEIAAGIKPVLSHGDAYKSVDEVESELREFFKKKEMWAATVGTRPDIHYFLVMYKKNHLILVFSGPISLGGLMPTPQEIASTLTADDIRSAEKMFETSPTGFPGGIDVSNFPGASLGLTFDGANVIELGNTITGLSGTGQVQKSKPLPEPASKPKDTHASPDP